MADERDLNIDPEPIGSTADDGGGSKEISAVDGCAEVLNFAKRGINTRPGPDEAVRDLDDKLKGVPDGPREVRVRRDRR